MKDLKFEGFLFEEGTHVTQLTFLFSGSVRAPPIGSYLHNPSTGRMMLPEHEHLTKIEFYINEEEFIVTIKILGK